MSVDLDVVEARWRIGLISANDLHGVANELLDEGVSTDSLIDLFALPVDVAFWEGPALFDRALSELGRGRMTEAEAARVLSRHIARGVLSGALEPSQSDCVRSLDSLAHGISLRLVPSALRPR
jgi:hypothetical protein